MARSPETSLVLPEVPVAEISPSIVPLPESLSLADSAKPVAEVSVPPDNKVDAPKPAWLPIVELLKQS